MLVFYHKKKKAIKYIQLHVKDVLKNLSCQSVYVYRYGIKHIKKNSISFEIPFVLKFHFI